MFSMLPRSIRRSQFVLFNAIRCFRVQRVCNSSRFFKPPSQSIHFGQGSYNQTSWLNKAQLKNNHCWDRGKSLHKSELISRNKVNPNLTRYPCYGYATADEYHLSAKLQSDLSTKFNIYPLPDEAGKDALFCSFPISTSDLSLSKEFVLFWDGVVVFWNCNDQDKSVVFDLLKSHETGSHPPDLIDQESEHLEYVISEHGGPARVLNNTMVFNPSCFTEDNREECILTKFTFSEAIRLSVRLGVWENQLSTLAESVDGVIDDLRGGRHLRISRSDVLRHCGNLLMLRHRVNIDSDLLQTPDFYWDRPELEDLFLQTRGFLNISQRTRLVNEKLNHSFELTELLRSHLNDSHHTRLEVMIIVLIAMELVFGVLPSTYRFFTS